ncbi:MAG: DUF2946 family protein [Methylocystis sp.]|uniref:DUF2946 family protein n=1 Tax=Methylocystis sp. TaxID=1911079 RepID=UPI003D11C36C
MRPKTLRTLLIVLAMVIQTVAGGAGLARAALMPSGDALSTRCHQLSAAEQSAPNDRDGHEHHCQSCLMCCEPPAAWVSLLTDYVVALAGYAVVDTPTYAVRPLAARPSRAHSARAPPVTRA